MMSKTNNFMLEKTDYPIVVSMSSVEWECIMNNLQNDAEIPEDVLLDMRLRRLIVPTPNEEYRLSDPVSDIVRMISDPKKVISVECPSGAQSKSTIHVFINEEGHMIACRYQNVDRIDFLLSELKLSPLESFMKLVSEVRIQGECPSVCYTKTEPKDFRYEEGDPIFRITFDYDEKGQNVYAMFPRKQGGAWLLKGSDTEGSVVIRQGSEEQIHACLRNYLIVELETL